MRGSGLRRPIDRRLDDHVEAERVLPFGSTRALVVGRGQLFVSAAVRSPASRICSIARAISGRGPSAGARSCAMSRARVEREAGGAPPPPRARRRTRPSSARPVRARPTRPVSLLRPDQRAHGAGRQPVAVRRTRRTPRTATGTRRRRGRRSPRRSCESSRSWVDQHARD